ncbi:MAG: RNA-binding protein [Kiritimatiellaceae bacterium]|nr:RNA-binding protein [Kiritimatiellaceae bacterium]|tara:strand:+ start:301 stop:516 length:216 start_codon:yes stop_codon:yes gene_type:complete
MIKFPLKTETIELCRLLKAVNVVASGAEGKEVISEGWVQVDGHVETRKRCKIRAGQIISFDGKIIHISAPD